MAILPALHGRARMRRAGWVRLLLLCLLLLVPIGLRALEVDVLRFVRFAARGAWTSASVHLFYVIVLIVAIAGYAGAGTAIDRLGAKRVFACVLLAWTALVALGATVIDPTAYRTLSPLLTNLLPCFVITGVLVVVRLAWPLRRRGIVVALLLCTYERAAGHGLPLSLFARPDHDFPETWQYPILALVTAGTVLFAAWVFGCPEVDRASGLDLRPPPQTGVWRAILVDRTFWIILAIQLCQLLVLIESRGLRWDYQNSSDTSALVLGYAIPVAFLVAAWASDRLFRRRRNWVSARRPFLIVGFVVAAIAPVFAVAATQSGPALQIIDLLALGTLRIDDLLTVDAAPRRYAGRYIGLLLAGEAAGGQYLFPFVRSFEVGSYGIVAVIFVASLAGLALSIWAVPKLRPAE